MPDLLEDVIPSGVLEITANVLPRDTKSALIEWKVILQYIFFKIIFSPQILPRDSSLSDALDSKNLQ